MGGSGISRYAGAVLAAIGAVLCAVAAIAATTAWGAIDPLAVFAVGALLLVAGNALELQRRRRAYDRPTGGRVPGY